MKIKLNKLNDKKSRGPRETGPASKPKKHLDSLLAPQSNRLGLGSLVDYKLITL